MIKKVSFENRARMLYNVPELMSAPYTSMEERAYLKGVKEYKEVALYKINKEIKYIQQGTADAYLAKWVLEHIKETLENLEFNLEIK